MENVWYNFAIEIQGNQLDITQTQSDPLRTTADFGCKSLAGFWGDVTFAVDFRMQTSYSDIREMFTENIFLW